MFKSSVGREIEMQQTSRRRFRRSTCLGTVFLSTLIISASSARAEITIIRPTDGSVTSTPPCSEGAICFGTFEWIVEVSGSDADRVEVVYDLVGGDRTESVPFCFTNVIEQRFCPTLPRRFERPQILEVGTWDARVRVERGNQIEESEPVRLTVIPFAGPLPGTVALREVVPNRGNPPIRLTDSSSSISASTADIIGRNLHDNPFIRVFFAPIPVNEVPLTSESALPVGDWCRTEVPIEDRGELDDGSSWLRVRVPELPETIPSRCGFQPDRELDITEREWRWSVLDTLIREEQVHRWWAIPSPRDVPWADEPPFSLGKPDYPKIDGFGFENEEDDPTYREFLTVYGNNAYLCAGAFGVCATRIPDPLYHALWWPIYRKAIASTGGSCNGMAATSRLMANEDLQTEDFDPSVYFPVGFTERDDTATYDDPSFCTPLCGPPEPRNLWAHIRMNHGAQISREFLSEILETVGNAIFDPTDLTSIRGAPNVTLERVRENPESYVLCFFEWGGGHCVTPYRVEGDRMWIYDNNDPRDSGRFIDIVDGDYDYPGRRNQGKTPNRGDAIVAFPISIWKGGRHLMGLSDFALQFGDVEFLYMIAVGDAGMTVSTDEGGRWGEQPDGSVSDELPGSVALPLAGPNDESPSTMQLMMAMDQPAPTVEIAAHGTDYGFFAGQGGTLLQLETANATSGARDQLRIRYERERLGGFDFSPEDAAAGFVPRVGLEIGRQERAVFEWMGLRVSAGGSVGFDADLDDLAVDYRNDTGETTRHVLALLHAAGEEETSGRTIYGPFDVPAGATHRVVVASWPDVGAVRSELDLDRDGAVDRVETVPGVEAVGAVELDREADVFVATEAERANAGPGEPVEHRVVAGNAGPAEATGVRMVGALSADSRIELVGSARDRCTVSPVSVRCDLGTILPNRDATVTYVVTPKGPRAPGHLATAFAAERDPDLANNASGNGAPVPTDADQTGDDASCSCTAASTSAEGICLALIFLIGWVSRLYPGRNRGNRVPPRVGRRPLREKS